MARKSTKEMALPVGLFIILGLVILVGGILWLRNYTSQPAYSFYVAYRDPAPVAEGVAVYYRGVKVGNVSEVGLAQDYRMTLLRIGIMDAGLRIPESSEIRIQMEGITGQRFVTIDPPDDGAYLSHIQPEEVIWGKESLTLEKLQEQLARIAENRTLEKILEASEQTLAQLQVASGKTVAFLENANQFLGSTQAPTQRALDEFALAARDFRSDFSGFSSGADETMLTLRETGNRINLLIGEVGTQFEETQVLRNISEAALGINEGIQGIEGEISDTAREIRGGVSGLQGTNEEIRESVRAIRGNFGETAEQIQGGVRDVRGGVNPAKVAPEVAQLQSLLSSMEQSAQGLRQEVATARAATPNGQLKPAYDRLETLSEQIIETVENNRLELGAGAQPETVQQQLAALREIGQQISQTSEALNRDLEQRLAQRALASDTKGSLQNLQETVDTLASIGQSLQVQASIAAPKAEEIASYYSTPVRVRGGGYPGLAGTIQQFYDTAERFECVAANMNDILNERFLLFKLMFGKPGGDIDCSPQAVRNVNNL